MSTTTLAGKPIGTIGYGMMGLTWRQKPQSMDASIEALKATLEMGQNFWNGGEFYGTPDFNSLHVLKEYFTRYPADADKVVLSIKGGWNPDKGGIDASPENTRRCVERSVALLAGCKKIDLYELARVDKDVPIETTMGVLKELMDEGKIGGISLSELGAEKIERAVKVAPISAVEVEVSLMAQDIFENGVAQMCAKHNIPIVAYSPMARGLLMIQSASEIDPSNIIHQYPRFQGEALEINLSLVKELQKIAASKGCTPSQLAINWLTTISKRNGNPEIIPIPGSSSPVRVRENGVHVALTDDDLSVIQSYLDKIKVVGERYPEHLAAHWDF